MKVSHAARTARVKAFRIRQNHKILRTILRAFAAYRYELLCWVFHIYALNSNTRKQRRARALRARQRLATRTRRNVLTALRSHVRKQRKLRLAAHVMESKWMTAMLSEAVSHWKFLTRSEHAVRALQQRRAVAFAVKAFSAWKRRTAVAKKCRQFVMTRHVHAWRTIVKTSV